MGTRQLVVGAVIVDSLTNPTRVLGARRSRPPELAGLWEFPGGKVEAGESPQEALVREIREELNVGIRVDRKLGAWPINEHLELCLSTAEIVSGKPTPGEAHDAVRWFAAHALTSVRWLPTDEWALPAVIEAATREPPRLRP